MSSPHANIGAPLSFSSTTHRGVEPRPFVPRLTLFSAPVVVHAPEAGTFVDEDRAALASLTFDYASFQVRSSAPARRGGQARSREDEDHARVELERWGAVDLRCLPELAEVSSRADYLIDLEASPETLGNFAQRALPTLRARGWSVHVDQSYPFQLVDQAPTLSVEEHNDGWFNLQLGIVVEGRSIDLLPMLLDLIDRGDLVGHSSDEVFLRLNDSHYLALERDRLRRILRTVVELHGRERQGDGARLPATHAQMIHDLATGFDIEEPQPSFRGSSIENYRAKTPEAPPPESPRGLRAALRSYQRQGVAWLHQRARNGGGILADDMGLGKTLQTIAHLLQECETGVANRPSLVITPTSLIESWKNEFSRFAPSLTVIAHHGPRHLRNFARWCVADVVITSYPLVLKDCEEFHLRDFHAVVLDEAQTIKNSRSRINRAVNDLHAHHRLCLTGTPVENGLDELWALIDFVNPGFLGSKRRFRELYRDPIEKDGSEERLEALRHWVSPLILRRSKSQVASELPAKTELIHHVELEGDQRDLYESIRVAAHERVRRAVRHRGVSGATVQILDALMKLRQVCCDPRLVGLEAAASVVRSAKYERLFKLVVPQLAHGHRFLIFSQFTSMLELIEQGFAERRIATLKLTGKVRERQSLVERFQRGEANVFLISLKAGGVGLTLTGADNVIHYDPWWNPAIQAQATDRAHRIGQRRRVFATSLIAAGSVEERIIRLQRKKSALAEQILAPGLSALRSMTSGDVDGLFEPLP